MHQLINLISIFRLNVMPSYIEKGLLTKTKYSKLFKIHTGKKYVFLTFLQ